MYEVFQRIESAGVDIYPTRGSAKELQGFLLELTNPLARLSRTETRGKPFSCLGELLWYWAGSKALSFIKYYIPRYKESADEGKIYGGYGPRLFDWKGLNQFKKMAEILGEKPNSRQAVIQLFDAHDIVKQHKDVPCTCTLQFLIRDHSLHMITYMRSNDAFIGLPHDVFCFTMLQEVLARVLSVPLGTYKHMVGSLHLYENNVCEARKFLKEGLQPTAITMPPMPLGDPCPSIKSVLLAESKIRCRQELDGGMLNSMESYWADLVRLLLVFRYSKDKNVEKIMETKKGMSSDIYNPFIDGRISRLGGSSQ